MDVQTEIETAVIYHIIVGDISSALYALGVSLGIFALLSFTSIYFLLQRSNHQIRQVTLMLTLTLFALFASTSVYTGINILWSKQEILAWSRISGQGLSSLYKTCNCAKTATLTINIILGDAIVCWRAYTIWQGNRFILSGSIALLLATFALGTVDMKHSCTYPLYFGSASRQIDPNADGSGTLYEGVWYGVAASVLSLATNLYATGVVALKAWKSRRALRRYIVAGPIAAQSGKVLSLIVESGAIYCAIWVFVVTYQTGQYTRNPDNDQCSVDPNCQAKYYHSFWYIFGLIVDSSLVPLIAIYPTIIIILVALNRSHMENGFIKATESSLSASVPLRQLTITVDTTETTQSDMGRRSSSETVLAICEGSFQLKDGTEGSSTHTSSERNPDIIV